MNLENWIDFICLDVLSSLYLVVCTISIYCLGVLVLNRLSPLKPWWALSLSVVVTWGLLFFLEGSYFFTTHNLRPPFAYETFRYLFWIFPLGLMALVGFKKNIVIERWLLKVTKTHWPLMVVLGLACMNRLLVVFAHFDMPAASDAIYYDYFSHTLALTGELSRHISVVPGFLLFWSGVLYFLGHTFWVHQLVNVLLGMGATWCVFQAGKTFFRNQTAGFISAFLFAVQEAQFLYVHIAQIENFFIPLCALYLYRCALYWNAPHRYNLLAVSVVAAAIFLTRTQGVSFIISFFILVAVLPFRRKFKLAQMAFFLSILGFFVAIWGVYNLRVNDKLLLTSEQTTSRFAVDNSPQASHGLVSGPESHRIEADLLKKYPNSGTRNREAAREIFSFYISHWDVLKERLTLRALATMGWLAVNGAYDKPPFQWSWNFDTAWGWWKETFVLVAAAGLVFAVFAKQRINWFLLSCFMFNFFILLGFSMSDPRCRYPFDICLALICGGAFWQHPSFFSESENHPCRWLSGKSFKHFAILSAVIVGILLTRFFLSPLQREWLGAPADSSQTGSMNTTSPGPNDKILSIDQLNPSHLGQTLFIRAETTNYFSKAPHLTIGQFLTVERRETGGQFQNRHDFSPFYVSCVYFQLGPYTRFATGSSRLREREPILIKGVIEEIQHPGSKHPYFYIKVLELRPRGQDV